MRKFSCLFFQLFVIAVTVGSCHPKPPVKTEAADSSKTVSKKSAPAQKPISFRTDAEESDLVFSLSESSGQTHAKQVAVSEGKALSAEAIAKLLKRAADGPKSAAEKTAFAMRPSSLPAPKTGERIDTTLGATGTKPPTAADNKGKLTVESHSPEGAVELVPHVSITFSKPMVSVSGRNDLETSPVTLTPMPKGRWRWLGTRTLLFQPEKRMPMATRYTVTVPKQTKSMDGTTLGEDLTFSFETPPVKLMDQYPAGGPHELDQTAVLVFNQHVEAEAMLPFIEVEARGKKIDFRMATDAEQQAFVNRVPRFKEVFESESTKAIAISLQGLPVASTIEVKVLQGAPSAEGPKKTEWVQNFDFYTYHPFQLNSAECGWGGDCSPSQAFVLEFNNRIDESAFTDDLITVSPAIPNMEISRWGDQLSIMGLKQGNTTYTVNISNKLKDVYGQKLKKSESAKFTTGRLRPTLVGPPGEAVTISPFDTPAVAVHSMNHKKLQITVNRVDASVFKDWAHWKTERRRDADDDEPMPGKRLYQKTLTMPKNDEWQHSVIDLSKYIEHKAGHFAIMVHPLPRAKNPWERQEVVLWVQVTEIGVSVFREHEQLIAWASALRDGSPLKDVTFTLWPGKTATALSDEAGMAQMALPDTDSSFMVAKKGYDTAIVYPDSVSSIVWGGGHWTKVTERNKLSCYAVSDRGMYKPGEKVHITGWLREIDTHNAATISKTVRPVKKVRYTLTGPRRNPLASGEVTTTALGGFHIQVTLPKNVNLGTAELELVSDRGDLDFPYSHKYHHIQIQEFKKPEFEVSAQVDEGPHILGETAEASITASYYTGESLLGAPVQWHVSTSPGSYSPPNHGDFTFGTYRPFWWYWGMPQHSGNSQTFEGRTGAGGVHKLDIHFESLMSKEPTNVFFTGTVMDVNRQQWTANTSLLVHPANRYVGLKLKENFVRKNETVPLDVVVTNIDGERTSGEEVSVDFVRMAVTWKDGRAEDTEESAGSCVFRSVGTVHTCDFTPTKAGQYKWIATTRDKAGRPAQSTMWVWVTGDDLPKSSQLKQDEVRIIPKKETVAPGENVELLIMSPFYPAEGLVTARKAGIRFNQRISFDGPQATVKIPITEMDIPSVNVQVDINGVKREDPTGDAGGELKRPAFASGRIAIEVSPYKKQLSVAVKPVSSALAPRGKANVAVTITDSSGAPKSNAEVALWVVDEAVLALSGYTVPDPVALFYAPADDAVSDTHSRSTILQQEIPSSWMEDANAMVSQSAAPLGGYADGDAEMAMPSAMEKEMPRPAPKMVRAVMKKGEGAGAPAPAPILVRSNFDALAFYKTTLQTDASGTVNVSFTMPDSLTRYRVMAVAADDVNRFGNGESTMVVRLPLMVRPAAPRFLNFGDRFEFPVVVQNQTDSPQTVQVAVLGDNLVFGDSTATLSVGSDGKISAGKEIVVPASDRVEVRFAAATVQAGTAQVQVVAASRSAGDSAVAVIPVWTPATSEAFATYGSVQTGNVIQPVKAPKDVWRQFGGVEVTTSSTGLQALTDAFIYLVSYPYSCSEQLASKVLSIATLKDVLSAFNAEELPSEGTLKQEVAAALTTLKGRQNWNGEFGMWRRDGRSWPYANVHVANALAVANKKGFKVDSDMLQRSVRYLQSIDSYIPSWYSEDSKNSLRSYALYVLHKMGHSDEKKAAALIQRVGLEKLSFEAKGWLLPVVQKNDALKEKLLRDSANHVTQTAAHAHFVTSYTDGEYVLMHSDRRVDGIWLEGLLDVDAGNPLIEKLMSGLLAHRKQGRWESTQENAFVLCALDKYFHVYEKVTPDFVSRVWLGDRVSEGHAFKGRTTESVRVQIPMAEVPTEKENVIVEKTGAGRMYYRIGMRYAPKSLSLDAADEGFVVQRTYRGVDDDEDVWRDDRGVWHVRAAARVNVELTMVATSRRYHVALEDKLPAGFEPVNPALAVEQNVSDVGGSNQRTYWWWNRPWFEHQNMRDERVEAFASLLWDGVYTYSYEAKATTPGAFVVPPAKASEMYSPETFGRSSTDKVIIE